MEPIREQHEDREAFLPKDPEDDSFLQKGSREVPSVWKRYGRLILEIAMAFVIVALFLNSLSNRTTEKASPIPKFPRKPYTFVGNPRYLHDNMFSSRNETIRTLHNWIELSATGRGYVRVDNPESFDLPKPYSVKVNFQDKPAYMMSVFHQLHCLSYLVQQYQTAFDGAEITHEIAHHSAHCFDYLRQAIMCAADTSLEGETEAGPGWGSKHECTDYDALLAWADKNSVNMFRGILPEETVL